MTDKVYVFNKLTKIGTLLGEIQSDFNMSFVIDGTKDSAQVQVWSYSDIEIEPYSIILHWNTNTWWIVSHDKIERYQNDSGFVYVHNLELLGAIELLNARDLTDCGFNDNTYTIEEFLQRLFSLSSFSKEFSSLTLNANSTFLSQKVKFIKTFENYTYLSALREFLDAYNMCPKLDFRATYNSTSDTWTLISPTLNIVPKTGNRDNVYGENDFDIVEQTKTMDKDSFGTSVISNAENVISSIAKTYPSVGAVRPVAHEYQVKAENAVIKLPSKVFKANWLKMISNHSPVIVKATVGAYEYELTVSSAPNVTDNQSIENWCQRILDDIKARDDMAFVTNPGAFYDPFERDFLTNKNSIIEKIKLGSTITLYDGNKLVPYFGSNNNQTGTIQIQQGENVPYLVYGYYQSKFEHGNLIFCDKETKEGLAKTWQGIAWERGSDEITGFDGFEPVTGGTATFTIDNLKYTDLQYDGEYYQIYYFSNSYGNISIQFGEGNTFNYGGHFRDNLCWIVNYYPMVDLKVKIDNQREKYDIQLYNQTGKLTDNVALSKLINSYSKEISSDTITKNMVYYDFDDIPSVGDIVEIDNEEYVINNISLDFSQNDPSNYYIEGEFTMSKYVSTKSLMVNPNTNIRDYGIPQNYNVKRKQLYRDFYELDYALDSEQDTDYYISPNTIFTFGRTAPTNDYYTAVIRLSYEEQIEGSYSWYYQLETTKYQLDKMIYIVVDFNDNNIIGYGSQNVFSGFDISRVFQGFTDVLCTPISYVDNNGEVLAIDLLFLTGDNLTAIYDEYKEENSSASGYSSFDGTLYNYSVFIPQAIYTKANSVKTFEIYESAYKKDALEVPVFEYVCQIDDSENVLIGDNILTQHDDCIYFYSYVEGDNLNQNNVMPTNNVTAITSPIGWRLYNSATIDYVSLDSTIKTLRVAIYNYTTYRVSDSAWSNVSSKSFSVGKDYAIFRHAYNLSTQEETVDLLFIAKKVTNGILSSNQSVLTLTINHWKLD